MALFLDSIDLDEIRSAMELGIFAGLTTNPKLLAAVPAGQRLDRLAQIARVCRGSLYLQVDQAPVGEMQDQALTLQEIAPGRTVIKAPMSRAGLMLCAGLRAHQLPVCLTAVFSPLQAAAASAAGAHAVAVYLGRIGQAGGDGVAVLADCTALLAAAGQATRVLAASIPDAATLLAVLKLPGVDVTLPGRLLGELLDHPGTAQALEEFNAARATPDSPDDALVEALSEPND